MVALKGLLVVFLCSLLSVCAAEQVDDIIDRVLNISKNRKETLANAAKEVRDLLENGLPVGLPTLGVSTLYATAPFNSPSFSFIGHHVHLIINITDSFEVSKITFTQPDKLHLEVEIPRLLFKGEYRGSLSGKSLKDVVGKVIFSALGKDVLLIIDVKTKLPNHKYPLFDVHSIRVKTSVRSAEATSTRFTDDQGLDVDLSEFSFPPGEDRFGIWRILEDVVTKKIQEVIQKNLGVLKVTDRDRLKKLFAPDF